MQNGLINDAGIRLPGNQPHLYDCAVVGGGLAGLCLAIQLADKGISVALFEKGTYPFHKVCGEYISMESWDFLTRLGLPLADMGLPRINQLGISSEGGFMLDHELKMGGFGISRYSLDEKLSKLAEKKGVCVFQNCRVNHVKRDFDRYQLSTTKGDFISKVVCGSYGKYAPGFVQAETVPKKPQAGSHYIGVKYHIRNDLSLNRIELHNFKNGYCGISKVDHDWYCLCYLTAASNLLENGKDIARMEEHVLYKNKFLRHIFTTSEFVNAQPHVISNVQFSKKQTDMDGIFLLGDAAGSITPLCGNGMSMGMRSSQLLAGELITFFKQKQLMNETTEKYRLAWNEAFNRRITAGYYLQHLFGKKNTTDLALRILSKFPSVTGRLVTMTHGRKF
jgi:flavin-dependent dehydrogenase